MTYNEFVKLCWTLLEAKIRYYMYPDISNMSDSEYDSLELQYLNYCKEHNLPNTIQSMVGIDKNRPSVQAAIHKLLMTEKP